MRSYELLIFDRGVKTRIIMTVDDDTTTSDNIKVPKFDHSNKTVSRDVRFKAYVQSFKCAAIAKFVMARLSFGKHVNNPLKWTITVESSWHELQGAIKRFDPEALGIQPVLRGSFAG